MSPLLPWLAILALLALKPNRGWSAWWILLPLAGLAAGWHCLALALQSSDTGLPEGMLEVFLDVPVAWGFGLAALWLLASYLGDCGRLRTFLGGVAVLAVFMVFSFAAQVGWSVETEPIMSLIDPRSSDTASAGVMGFPLLVPLLVPAAVFAAALALCGLACRGRYRPFAQWLWLFSSLLAVWVAASALLYRLCPMGLLGNVGYGLFLGIGLFMLAVTFATLLPFLILSAASRLFRERLKMLLHVKPAVPPANGAAASLAAVTQCH